MNNQKIPKLPEFKSSNHSTLNNLPELPDLSSFKNTPQNRTQIIYHSDIMVQLMKIVDKISAFHANTLVLGESGTGKELIARSIHEKSNRSQEPFIAINCSALKETLLESELFGHEKGSFTGAYNKKVGLAEVANGGTLFLDEIGELSLTVQSKLLRFLQEGEFFRVGGRESIKVDVRLICATNRNLETEIQKGSFREDLYYRINTVVIDIPPLRRRKEDIPLLIKHFFNKIKISSNNRSGIYHEIDPDALTTLLDYNWPGNIRELQNVCERLSILTEGHTIMPKDLPEQILQPEDNDMTAITYDSAIPLNEIEKRYILKALKHFGGNKTQAASALGITIKTLYNKLHEYGKFDQYSTHSKPKD